MEPCFKVHDVYDAESYRQLISVGQQLYEKNPKRWIYLITGAFAILWGSQVSTGQLLVDWVLRILLFAAAMVLVAPCHRAAQKSARRMMERRSMESGGETAVPVSFSFYGDRFEMADDYGESRLPYSSIENCAETEDYFLLFGSRTLCYLLPKRDFRLGTPEDFRGFLEEKCQKPVSFYQVD